MSKVGIRITWRNRGVRVVLTGKHWQDVVRGMKEAAREVIRQAFERFPLPAGLAAAVAKHDALATPSELCEDEQQAPEVKDT